MKALGVEKRFFCILSNDSQLASAFDTIVMQGV